MKKLIFSLALLFVGATAYAEDTDISKYDNVVYIESGAKITLEGDGTAIIPVKMKNSVEATGYQFTLTLPAGIEASNVTIKKSTTRKADEVSFSAANQTDGTIKVVAYTSDGLAFSGNDGEVATITIAKAVVGSYTFNLSGIEVTAGGTAYKVDDAITSTVNIKSYDDGYSLQVEPFKMVVNQEYDEDITNTTDNKIITLTRTNTVALKQVSFDIVLPENISIGQYSYVVKKKTYYDYDPYYYNEYGEEAETPTLTDNEDGSVNVSAEKGVSASSGTPFIVLPIVSTDALAEGVYEITFKNIVMTDESDNTYKAAPYTANIFVGAPKASVDEGKVTFSGDYSDTETAKLLTDAIPSDNTAVTEVDLIGVTALPASTTITVANPNAIIETKTDLSLANTKNVVIGDQCEKFELTDSYNFAASKSFTAENASYSRSMTTTWGTICLPYEVKSDASVAYYNIKEIKSNTLYLEKYETLPTGTPAIVKKLSGSEIAPKATSVSVSGELGEVSGTVTMIGTYTNNTKVTAANAYYLKDNKFYQCNGFFYINAFRAYFTIDSSAKVFEIEDGDATGIEETGLSPTSTNSTNNEEAYNLQGIKVDGSYKGIVIKNGKKVLNK